MRFTWTGILGRFQEIIARTRAVEMAQAVFGFPTSLPDMATLWAALCELLAASPQVVNVKSFGAKGDGVTDDTAAIQAAIGAAASGAWIDLGGRTCRCAIPLSAGAGFKLRNGTIDFRDAGAVSCITSTGGSVGSDIALTADAASGDLTLTVASVTGLASGDFLILKSAETWNTLVAGFTSEVVRIRSISGLVLTLYDAVDYNYVAANSPVVAKITYVEGWRFQNVHLIGDSTALQMAIRPQYLKDAVFDNVSSEGFRSRTMEFRTGYNIEVRNPNFYAADPTNLGSGTGYGIAWTEGCHDCRAIGGLVENYNHAVTIGGSTWINRYIKTIGMTSKGCTGAGFDSHPTADHVMFSDLQVQLRSGSTMDGVISQAPRTIIDNIQVSGPDTSYGVRWEPCQAADVPVKGIISNIQLDGPSVRIVYVHQLGTRAIDSCLIDNIQFVDVAHPPTSDAIEVDIVSGNAKNISVTNFVLEECGAGGVNVHCSAGRTINGVVVTSGSVKISSGVTQECVAINGTDANSVTGVVVNDLVLENGNFGVRTGQTAGSVDDAHIGSAIRYKNHSTAKFRTIGALSTVAQKQEVGADVGDAAKTLTLGIDELRQIWATPLTAARAVTLSTTGAVKGAQFRITRKASATGASSLNVGTGPLKALAAGQWCLVEYDGTAWFLSEFGSL